MNAKSSAALPQHPALWRGMSLADVATPSVASGFAALDAVLPGGGWPAGALTEILPAHEGIGELRLLGLALGRLSREQRLIAWIAPPHLPYAPALDAAGIDLAHVLIVRTRSDRETLWAAEQALRAAVCGAVLAWPGRVQYAELRRLQIAADNTRSLAMLFRAPRAESESSPAALRLALGAESGGLAVRIFKRRGGPLVHPVVIPAEPLQPAVTDHSDHAVDRPAPAAIAARSALAGVDGF